MLSYITLGTESLHSESATSKRIAHSAQGLEALAAPRQTIRNRPSAHGAIDTTRYSEGQTVVIDGECSGDTVEDAFTEWDRVKAALLATLPDGGTLKWRRGGTGQELQRTVKLASLTDPVVDGVSTQLLYQAQLHSPDPRAYSQTLQTVVGNPLTAGGAGLTFPLTFPFVFTESSGGEASVTNGGSRGTLPVIDLFGFATSPAVILVETGERVQLEGQISAGEFIRLDFATQQALLNGTVDRRNLLDNVASTFFEIPAATAAQPSYTLRMTAQNVTAEAHLEASWRAAY